VKMSSKPDSSGIMVVGSSNTDMVIKTDHFPVPGETVVGGDFIMVPGGKGANQAVAAARLGASVSFVARLGADVFGDKALENFEREGIDTEYIVRDPEQPSGIALIFVDRKGENVIVVAPGANSRLSPADVERASQRMAACSTLVLQLEVPLETVERAASLARERNVRVILNSAPMRSDRLPIGLLGNVDLLIANETEARLLLNLDPNAEVDEKAASALLGLGVGSAIITLGAKGAIIAAGEEIQAVHAFKVTPMDTTAAGDAFVGAVAAALSSGKSLLESARFASRAAALSVTRMGAQSSLPTALEVERFRA